MTIKCLVVIALVGCMSFYGYAPDDKIALMTASSLSSVAAAAQQCPGHPPPPVECKRVICNVNDLAWEYKPLPAGTLCRQTTGQCDGQGSCIVPPNPVPDPVIDYSNCPVCSSQDIQLLTEANVKYLGIKANNAKAPSSYGLIGTQKFNGTWGYGGAFDTFNGDNWLPIRIEKQILCGKLDSFGIERRGDENDWNIHLIPKPGFEDFIADAIPYKRSNWHGAKDDWFVARNGQYTIEAEITPDHTRYGNQWFPNSKQTPLLGKDICVYGPFVREESHGNRPEIHPSEILWWKEGDEKMIVLMVTDDSNRFDDEDDYTARNVTDPNWKTWTSDKHQQGEISIPFRVKVPSEAVYLGIHDLDALNFSRNAIDRDVGPGSKHTITYQGASVLTVEERNSLDPFTSITFRDVCFDRAQGTLQGYVVLSTFIGNGDGNEGFIALQINKKYLGVGDVKAVVVGDLLGTWKTHGLYNDQFHISDVVSSDQFGKGVVDGMIDFNGNGKTDLFVRANNTNWMALYDGKGEWQVLESSSFPTSKLKFGDVNGDGKTDILVNNDGMLQVSYGGTQQWKKIKDIGKADFQVADFNGDRITDIVRMDVVEERNDTRVPVPRRFIGVMKIMWSGAGDWKTLQGGFRFNTVDDYWKNFRFGDFNGDGVSDLFRYNNQRFLVYWNGTGDFKELQKPAFNVASTDSLMFVKSLTMPKTTDVIYVNPVSKQWTYNYGGKRGSLPITVKYSDPSTVRFGDLDGDPAVEPFTVDFVRIKQNPQDLTLPDVQPVALQSVVEPEYKANSLRRVPSGNGLIVDYVLQRFPGPVNARETSEVQIVAATLNSRKLAFTPLNSVDNLRAGVRSLGLIQSVPIGKKENELTVNFSGARLRSSSYEIPAYTIAAMTATSNEMLTRGGSWEKWNRFITSHLSAQYKPIAASAPPIVETIKSIEFELFPFYSTIEEGKVSIVETAGFVKELNEIVYGNNPTKLTQLFGSPAPFKISWTFELVDTTNGTIVSIDSSNFKISNGRFTNSKVAFFFPTGSSNLFQLKATAQVTDALGNQLERPPFEFWNQRARFNDSNQIRRWLEAIRSPSSAAHEFLVKRASYFSEDNLIKPNELLELFVK
ncbi:MAG: VCBS repeat-containing protein [Acidobacteria bacterium]|nr:VCBS repeat-containing protein [Acidobacteriota bacterium]